MKKPKKYLKFYKKCLSTGKMPTAGLCGAFHSDKFFDLVLPTYDERTRSNQDDNYGLAYWGRIVGEQSLYEFTPLRQTLVLLMAAMNNEL